MTTIFFCDQSYGVSDVSVDAVTRKAQFASVGSTYDDSVGTVTSGTQIQMQSGGSNVCYVTPPLAPVTISGTISVQMLAYETAMTANIGGHIKIYKRSTAGVLTLIASGSDGVEFSTSYTSMTWTLTPTSTAIAAGERLVIRWYIENVGTMAGSFSGIMTPGSSSIATTETLTAQVVVTGAATLNGSSSMGVLLPVGASAVGSGGMVAIGRLDSDPVGNGFSYGGANVVSGPNPTIKLDFSTETWSSMGLTPAIKRWQYGALASSEFGYIVGGYTGVQTTEVLRFDFATGATSASASQLPSANYSQHCSTYGSVGFLLGGYSGTTGGYKLTFATEGIASISVSLPANTWVGGGTPAASKDSAYIAFNSTGRKFLYATETESLHSSYLPGFGRSGSNNAACDGYVAVFGTDSTAVARGFLMATETAFTPLPASGVYISDAVTSNYAGYFRGEYSADVLKLELSTFTYSTMTAAGLFTSSSAATFNDLLKFSTSRPYLHLTGLGQTAAGGGMHLPNGVGYVVSGYYNGWTNNYADKLDFGTRTSAYAATGLATARFYVTSACSATKGFVFGGYLPTQAAFNNIDGVDLFSGALMNTVGALAVARVYAVAVASQTKAYIALGRNSAGTDLTNIESYVFGASTANIIAATFVQPRTTAAGVGNADNGYVTGTSGNTIERLAYATETRTVIAGTLSQARQIAAGVDNAYHGYFLSGYQTASTPYYVSKIDSLDFRTEVAVLESATCTPERYGSGAASGRVEGMACGGANSSGANIATISGVHFVDRTHSTWGAALSYQRSYPVGLSTPCESPYSLLLGQLAFPKASSKLYAGGGMGYLVGHPTVADGTYGLPRSTTKIHFATDTHGIAAFVAPSNYTIGANASSETYGYILGSSGKCKLHFASETYTAFTATLTYGNQIPASSVSTQLYGYCFGQSSGASRFAFATQTETAYASAFSTLYNHAIAFGAPKGTVGYRYAFTLYASPYTEQTAIDKLTYATMTSAAGVAALSAPRGYSGTGSGQTHATILGGWESIPYAPVNKVDHFTFATDTCAAAGANIAVSMSHGSTLCSTTTGWHGGGQSPNPTPGLYAATNIDKVTLATAAIAVSSASLPSRNQVIVAGLSSQGGVYSTDIYCNGAGSAAVTVTHIPGVRVSTGGVGTLASSATVLTPTPIVDMNAQGAATGSARMVYGVTNTLDGLGGVTQVVSVRNYGGYAYGMSNGVGNKFVYSTLTIQGWSEAAATFGQGGEMMTAAYRTRGYWAGGFYQLPYTDAVATAIVTRGDLVTDAVSSVSALAAARGGGASVSGPAKGYFFCGQLSHSYSTGVNTWSTEIDGILFSTETLVNPAAVAPKAYMRKAFTVASETKGYGFYPEEPITYTPYVGNSFSWVFATDTFGTPPQAFSYPSLDVASTVNANGSGYIFGRAGITTTRVFDFLTETMTMLDNSVASTVNYTGDRSATANAGTAYLFYGTSAATYNFTTNTFTPSAATGLEFFGAYIGTKEFHDNSTAYLGNHGTLLGYPIVSSTTGKGYSLSSLPHILNYTTEVYSRTRVSVFFTSQYPGGAATDAYGYLFGHSAFEEPCKTFSFILSTDTGRTTTSSFAVPRDASAVVYNASKAYLLGGRGRQYVYPYYYAIYIDSAESFTFSTETPATISATLKASRNRGVSLHSSTKGYYCTGYANNGVRTTEIESFTFGTETVGDPSAAVATQRDAAAGVFSTSKGYIGGGYSGSAYVGSIDTLTFSGESASTLSATLVNTPYGPTGLRSATKGYFCGGEHYSADGDQYLVFSSETTGALSSVMAYPTGNADGNMGVSSIPGSTETHFGIASAPGVGTASVAKVVMTLKAFPTFTGVGSATPIATVYAIIYGIAPMSGVGSAAASAFINKTWTGAAQGDGVGSAAAAGMVFRTATAALSGVGTMASSASKLVSGVGNSYGEATFAASGSVETRGAATGAATGGIYCAAGLEVRGQMVGGGVGLVNARAVLLLFRDVGSSPSIAATVDEVRVCCDTSGSSIYVESSP